MPRTPLQCRPFRRAGLAQLVVHLICNQGVGGSSPSAGTIQESKNVRRRRPRSRKNTVIPEKSRPTLSKAVHWTPSTVGGMARGIFYPGESHAPMLTEKAVQAAKAAEKPKSCLTLAVSIF